MGGVFMDDVVAVVILKILVAAVLKFLCGCDDVLWLTPFMAKATTAQKWGVGLRYVASVTILTAIAIALASALNAALQNTSSSEDDLVSKIVSIVAAALLASYAVWAMRGEGYFDDHRGVSMLEALPTYDACPEEPPLDEEDEASGVLLRRSKPDGAGENFRVDDVIVVACLGSLDDFIVYLSIALSGEFQWYELVSGIVLGAIVIATFVGSLMAASDVLAAYMSKIPVPIVLLLLAVYIVVAAFVSTLP